MEESKSVEHFLSGKSDLAVGLFWHFVSEFQKLGEVTFHPTKTMIGIVVSGKKVAWVTQLGKSFVHVVFPFETAYSDNLCFQKIAQVPGDDKQFNHHFRMLFEEDVNEEVIQFMKLAMTINGE